MEEEEGEEDLDRLNLLDQFSGLLARDDSLVSICSLQQFWLDLTGTTGRNYSNYELSITTAATTISHIVLNYGDQIGNTRKVFNFL
jgi:hypothetical protein